MVDPWSPTLGNGEVQLWIFAAGGHKRNIRKKITKSMVVTNFRIMVIDYQNNNLTMLHLLPNIDDVIVVNTHHVSQSVGYGVSTGLNMRTGQRFSSGTSKTVGDIIFIEK